MLHGGNLLTLSWLGAEGTIQCLSTVLVFRGHPAVRALIESIRQVVAQAANSKKKQPKTKLKKTPPLPPKKNPEGPQIHPNRIW